MSLSIELKVKQSIYQEPKIDNTTIFSPGRISEGRMQILNTEKETKIVSMACPTTLFYYTFTSVK